MLILGTLMLILRAKRVPIDFFAHRYTVYSYADALELYCWVWRVESSQQQANPLRQVGR